MSTGAGIPHAQDRLVADALGTYGDAPARLRAAGCMEQQMDHDARQPREVGDECHTLRRHRHFQAMTTTVQKQPGRLKGGLHHIGQEDAFRVQCQASIAEMRQVEKVVNEAGKMAKSSLDGIECLCRAAADAVQPNQVK